jgi:hypothetical protein
MLPYSLSRLRSPALTLIRSPPCRSCLCAWCLAASGILVAGPWQADGSDRVAPGWAVQPPQPIREYIAMPMGLLFVAVVICLSASAPPPAVAAPAQCGSASFPVNLTGIQLMCSAQTCDFLGPNHTTQTCLAACCARRNCTAWNYHVSSTNPSHHPTDCWLAMATHPKAAAGGAQDVWAGGSKQATSPYHHSGGGGAVIQPLSSWYYYGEAGGLAGTLNRELMSQSIKLLHARAAHIAELGADTAKWRTRQATVRANFGEGPFAPLPPQNRNPPRYNVTRTLRRPGFTCELVLFETRPGFWASGSIWTPTALRKSGAKAPGVLMVSGHTNDGFRSNNLGGLELDNDPPDDDYQVVEINLVARGFVVLAFDPLGQGERMQYADIPAGRPDPAEPWGKGAPGSFVWGATSDHEYIGREASPCTAPARYPGTVSQDVAWARGLTGCGPAQASCSSTVSG